METVLTKFEKGKEYTYEYIEENAGELSMREVGENTIGENFIILSDGFHTISFVLTGTRGDNYIYECVYL